MIYYDNHNEEIIQIKFATYLALSRKMFGNPSFQEIQISLLIMLPDEKANQTCPIKGGLMGAYTTN